MSKDSPTNLQRIKQIAVPVRNVDEASRFYRDTLGLKHLFDAPPALSFFDCGGVRLMLAGPEAQGKDGAEQHPVLFYDVSDIKKVHAKIKSSGAASIEEPHIIARMNGREVWISSVSDGQGNVVSLMSEVAEA
ncbi:MAG: methylmalonyl-CoA/ethylmalonyl-CoA epimerase [Gemmatimonadaceae bacterium]|jgi:methylmalonyl-CoA/ethylmalonyl-CoA epimerase|nr:methylmalonyl-CoA/ethylmalonyl-CoA epimerase [Gemmatimonadaceae bacterium]